MTDTLEYIKQKYNITEFQPRMDLPGGRWIGLARLFAELKFNVGAEIGVETGAYSEFLCKANPDLKLYSIDAWTAYAGWNDYNSQDRLDEVYEGAKKRLAPYNCEIIKAFSMDAVKMFEDNSLDFVFIDGAHDLRSVIDDISSWSKKVRKGGIISGHDFFRSKGPYINHVVDAVSVWTYAYKIVPWFVIRGDQRSSWMWVKQ